MVVGWFARLAKSNKRKAISILKPLTMSQFLLDQG